MRKFSAYFTINFCFRHQKLYRKGEESTDRGRDTVHPLQTQAQDS